MFFVTAKIVLSSIVNVIQVAGYMLQVKNNLKPETRNLKPKRSSSDYSLLRFAPAGRAAKSSYKDLRVTIAARSTSSHSEQRS